MDLSVLITANSKQFNQELNSVKNKIRGLSADLGKAFAGTSLGGVAGLAGGGAILGLALSMRKAVEASAEFGNGMAKINTIARVSQRDLQSLGDEILKLSRRMGSDIGTTQNAVYEALSANIPVKDVMKFTEVAQTMARASVTDVKTAVDLLSSAMNAYQKDTSDATHISDIFFKTQELGKVTIEELANDFGRVGAIAYNAGISLEEVSAAIATISVQGIRASEAVTEVRQLIVEFLQPSKELTKVLEIMRNNFGYAAWESKDFQEKLQLIYEHLKGNQEAIKALFPRVEAYNGMIQLTGASAEKAASQLGQMKNTMGSSAGAMGNFTDGMGKAKLNLDQMTASLNAMWITFGNKVIPAITAAADAINYLTTEQNKNIHWTGYKAGFYMNLFGAQTVYPNFPKNKEMHTLAFMLTPEEQEREKAIRERIQKKEKNIGRGISGKTPSETAEEQRNAIKGANSAYAEQFNALEQLADGLKNVIHDKSVMINFDKKLIENADQAKAAFLALQKDVEDGSTKLRVEQERLNNHVDKLKKKLAEIADQDAFEEMIKRHEKAIDKAAGKIEKYQDRLSKLLGELSQFGITDITKSLTENIIGGSKDEKMAESIQSKIRYNALGGRQAAFTSEEIKAMQDAEQKRMEAVELQQKIVKEQERIEKERTAIVQEQENRAKAKHDAEIKAIQEKIDADQKTAAMLESAINEMTDRLSQLGNIFNQFAKLLGLGELDTPKKNAIVQNEQKNKNQVPEETAENQPVFEGIRMELEPAFQENIPKKSTQKRFRRPVQPRGFGPGIGAGKSFSQIVSETGGGVSDFDKAKAASVAAGAAAAGRDWQKINDQKATKALERMEKILDERLPKVAK
jgi:TP901 family phage tail tape measure protein